MKTAISALVFLALGSFAYSEIPLIPAAVADSTLVSGNNEFAFDLFGEVCSMQEDGNVFLSPFSISMALGMTWNGASGETAQEMASLLHFTLPVRYVNEAFQRVSSRVTSGSLNGMESGEPFTMTVVNGIWVQNGFELLNSFTSAVTEYFSAGVENLDFQGDARGSRETINDWVAEHTMQNILDLIPEGMLGADTRLVLTNAVYFKAGWQHPFNELATGDGRFMLECGSEVIVPMMTQTEYFDYASSGDWQAVSMAYAGGDASMLIILPVNMDEFLEGFHSDMLATVHDRMSRVNVHLTMPKFEFTRSMSLSDILISMGMESAFTGDANFRAITGGLDLYISEVVHKAYVKVDEEGTEAAAATAVGMALTAMPDTPMEMNVNRPFVFIIEDTATGSIIFMGKIANPL